MARGVTTDNQTVYKIMSLYFMYNNYSRVARELNMPIDTVEDIVKRNINKEEFTKLHNETKRKFSKDFEEIIDLAVERLKEEIKVQDRIPVSQLSTVVGTLYDKNRLENDESTENTNNTINISFNAETEELSK